MAQSSPDGVAQVAGRILIAWRKGDGENLERELQYAQNLAADTSACSTVEMERVEVLSGAAESLRQGRRQAGAVRLIEHLATPVR